MITRMNEVYLVKSEFRDENFNYTTQKLLGDITLSGINYQYGYVTITCLDRFYALYIFDD